MFVVLAKGTKPLKNWNILVLIIILYNMATAKSVRVVVFFINKPREINVNFLNNFFFFYRIFFRYNRNDFRLKSLRWVNGINAYYTTLAYGFCICIDGAQIGNGDYYAYICDNNIPRMFNPVLYKMWLSKINLL